MNFTYWTGFSKRRNSTKIPSGTGNVVSCVLKEDTSITRPTIKLHGHTFFNVSYGYIADFGRYYFINEMKTVGPDTEIDLTVDVLATYKTAIGNTSAYILYDTAANTEIVDNRLPLKATPVTVGHVQAIRSDFSDAGTYIVTLTGEHTVGSYVVTRSTLDALMPNISTVFDTLVGGSASSGSTLGDIYQSIRDSIKQMVASGNVSENIRDVRWIPFTVTGDVLTPLYVGQYAAIDSGGVHRSGSLIETRLDYQSVNINVPWQFNDWRDSDRFTQIQLYLPYVGIINYPANQLKGIQAITIDTSLDRITGDIAYFVYAAGTLLGTYGASPGVSIPLGSCGLNPARVAGNIIAGAASAAFGSIPGVIMSGLDMVTPISQTVGGIGSGAAAKLPNYGWLNTICHDTSVAPSSVSAVMGTPSNEVKTIGSLSGYVQCQDASVSCTGTAEEKSEINERLNAGFFYE